MAAILAFGSTAGLVVPTATWTVKPGGTVAVVTGKLMLTDTKTGVTITCTSSALSGTLKSGNGLPGTDVGTISSVSFTGCRWPLRKPELTPELLPWRVNLTSYRNGVVHGTVSHIEMGVLNAACTFAISHQGGFGTEKFTYHDSTNAGTFTGGNLHVTGGICGSGAVHIGDPISMSASFKLVPAQAITSP